VLVLVGTVVHTAVVTLRQYPGLLLSCFLLGHVRFDSPPFVALVEPLIQLENVLDSFPRTFSKSGMWGSSFRAGI
jgi:hypothetical protein